MNLSCIETVDEVEEYLRDISEECSNIDQRMHDLSLCSNDLDILFAQLNILKFDLEIVHVDIKDFLEILGEVAIRIREISKNIREKKIQQIRLESSIKYIKDVKMLKEWIQNLYYAIDQCNWDVAAKYVSEIRGIEAQVIEGKFAATVIPTENIPMEPKVALQDACDALNTICLKGFHQAAEIKDEKAMTRFFRLFPIIGKSKEGLNVYSEFISNMVIQNKHKLMSAMGILDEKSIDTKISMSYALIMQDMFEYVANIMNHHLPVIKKHYNCEDTLFVIEKIHEKCIEQCSIIIDSFWEERQVEKKLSFIQMYSFEFLIKSFSSTLFQEPNSSLLSQENKAIDIKNIDLLVEEISSILNHWSLYHRFISVKCMEQKQNKLEEIAIKPDSMILATLKMPCYTRLCSIYERMELFFMRHSVEKAFQLDEQDTMSKPLMSSFVDDIMYILKKIVQRVLNTGNLVLLQDVLTGVKRIMEMDYTGIIQRRIIVFQGKLNNQAFSKNQNYKNLKIDNDFISFIILLNNLDISRNYIERIVSESINKDAIKKKFPFESDLIIIFQPIQALLLLQDRLNELLKDGLNTLFLVYIKIRLKKILTDYFNKSTYIINNTIFNDLEKKQPIQLHFSQGWNLIMTNFKHQLTHENMNYLVKMSSNLIANWLEKAILNIKMNELGAIRLDKDISFISSHIISYGSYQSHESFAKVYEMIRILNWDFVQDPLSSDLLETLRFLSIYDVEMLLKRCKSPISNSATRPLFDSL
ncbi:hypothetical protein PNEG_00963 [Pneumocystis murina B123]|uniref:Conserved oligomeric Golgi complex subunit 4 n=1 Tax=Pneumocystis murina (strain B123) TaxID=1069680 RepID=M7NUP8_PNEMU|nr:hypothetical protein PNEG_00963 [Pneumocystis murina B123]EMR10816.1 hypothetical protein PNEG_00963 [Pneumocystis murina B123]